MSGTDDVLLAARVVGSLVVVLVLVALAARAARRARGRSGTASLRVVERVGLSKETSIVVVEAGTRSLLVGVGPHGVSLLATLGPPDAGEAETEDAVDSPDDEADESDMTAWDRTSGDGNPHDDDAGEVPDDARSPRLPAGVDVEAYPDLAAALRAAGRTLDSREEVESALAPTLPRRRDLRRARALGSTGPRVPRPRAPQAGGSVLSPATWRQGVDALRDLTVRRG